jgi:hypothetical protein
MDLVNFMDTPEMRAKSGLKKRIDISTAQRWMKKLDYRWTYDPKGQYVDGHEQEDVVAYRQNVFLPRWANIKARTRDWSNGQPDPLPHEQKIVVWFHDESIFYANDRRAARWVHIDEAATPYAKGEGASQMVADLVSADYGWLRSPDGSEEARVLFKAGKNREGYFTSEDILKQTEKAIDILEKYYPNEDHVLVYDNATTHLKRPDGALSARKMPKFTSKLESNWLVEVNAVDANRKVIYTPDGKILKTKIQMQDATFADGTKQSLYFPAGHEKEGLFKGMAVMRLSRMWVGLWLHHPSIDFCSQNGLPRWTCLLQCISILHSLLCTRSFKTTFLVLVSFLDSCHAQAPFPPHPSPRCQVITPLGFCLSAFQTLCTV